MPNDNSQPSNNRRSVAHTLGRTINACLLPFGIEMRRKPQRIFSDSDADVQVMVGRYPVTMNSGNALISTFNNHPDYSGELGRLVRIVSTKYPKMAAIDVGANVGDTVAIIRSNADIPVVCVEGDSTCFNLLEQNIRQFSGVTAHQLFLGERTEEQHVSLKNTGWNTTLIPVEGKTESSVSLQLKSLDDFMTELSSVKSYKLLKIDAEGYDTKIIRGAEKLLEISTPVIFFEYNRENMSQIQEDGLATLAKLQDLGYEYVLFFDNLGRFFTSTTLANDNIVRDIHDYADGRHGQICYFDLCVFHESDSDIATEFLTKERAYRKAH